MRVHDMVAGLRLAEARLQNCWVDSAAYRAVVEARKRIEAEQRATAALIRDAELRESDTQQRTTTAPPGVAPEEDERVG